MKPLFRQESCFTFHNVSISTVCGTFLFYGWFYFTFQNVSISTVPAILFSLLFIVFTFHNVSISTIQAVDTNSLVATLHSTMYLFLHTSSLLPVQLPGYFTFHNVSISTSIISSNLPPFFRLYIPQCIYFYVMLKIIKFVYKLLYIPQCIYFYNLICMIRLPS